MSQNDNEEPNDQNLGVKIRSQLSLYKLKNIYREKYSKKSNEDSPNAVNANDTETTLHVSIRATLSNDSRDNQKKNSDDESVQFISVQPNYSTNDITDSNLIYIDRLSISVEHQKNIETLQKNKNFLKFILELVECRSKVEIKEKLNQLDTEQLDNQDIFFGYTILHWSVKENNYPLFIELLKRNVNVNLKTKLSQTCLHFAYFYKRANMIKELSLLSRMDQNIIDAYGLSAKDYVTLMKDSIQIKFFNYDNFHNKTGTLNLNKSAALKQKFRSFRFDHSNAIKYPTKNTLEPNPYVIEQSSKSSPNLKFTLKKSTNFLKKSLRAVSTLRPKMLSRMSGGPFKSDVEYLKINQKRTLTRQTNKSTPLFSQSIPRSNSFRKIEQFKNTSEKMNEDLKILEAHRIKKRKLLLARSGNLLSTSNMTNLNKLSEPSKTTTISSRTNISIDASKSIGSNNRLELSKSIGSNNRLELSKSIGSNNQPELSKSTGSNNRLELSKSIESNNQPELSKSTGSNSQTNFSKKLELKNSVNLSKTSDSNESFKSFASSKNIQFASGSNISSTTRESQETIKLIVPNLPDTPNNNSSTEENETLTVPIFSKPIVQTKLNKLKNSLIVKVQLNKKK